MIRKVSIRHLRRFSACNTVAASGTSSGHSYPRTSACNVYEAGSSSSLTNNTVSPMTWSRSFTSTSPQYQATTSSTKGQEGESEEKPIPDEESSTTTEEDAGQKEEAEATPPQPTKEEQLTAQVKQLTDQLKRSLAEQENTRRIAQRDVKSAKQFAVSSFAKSLLDTSDNLARAMESVPEEMQEDKENHAVLATLYEGIKMTENGLNKAFAKNGLVMYGEIGEVFDPNKHEALFEYPDENSTVGTVGQVMKGGFILNGRVLRSAEVGVIKK